MNQKDIEYLSYNISILSGVPVRIYLDNKYDYFYHSIPFPVDPVILYKDLILEKKEDIGYITTEDFFYYTFLKYDKSTIILGPFRLIAPTESLFQQMAFRLELSKDDIPRFIEAMKVISSLSLESVLQSLSMLYFILYGKKKTIKDILIDEEKIESMNHSFNKEIRENELNTNMNTYVNNSFLIEKELERIVLNGKIDELNKFISSIPPIHPGILSSDSLRQIKNTFIVTTTLISRKAILGGMDTDIALSLSDLYIQKMELLQNSQDIYTLQMNMILDYTKRVAKIRHNNNSSPLLLNLNKYILNHLSDPIKSDDICDNLYISKSALFKKIKEKTNMTLFNYILYVKINESYELLRYTDHSIASISIYLGFSSQSHFNHAFRKFTNMSPREYRMNLIKE